MRAHLLQIGQSAITVSFDPMAFELEATALLAWVERCARAVEAYYGVFPVAALTVRLRSFPGQGTRGGRAMATSPPRIELSVGSHASPRQLARNWSMTHEMVHLAFPNVATQHLWIEEGLASYVEPLARARVGWLTEADVWKEWLDNMHQGLPEPGDAGLDNTPTWGRTYWGGALFCLLADIDIRKRTGGRHELRDALRAIATRGNIADSWQLEDALRVGDEATGTTALQDLYRAMKDQPVVVDLDALWRELGVREERGQIRYTDTAPLAAIRKGLVLGSPIPGQP